MNWADLVVVLIFGLVMGLEVKRGVGLALFTAIGAGIALRVAMVGAGSVAKSVTLIAQPGPNEALVTGILFLLLMGVVTGITYVVRPDNFLSLEPFDGVLGSLCGVATAWAFCYAFMHGLTLWGATLLVENSVFAPEVLHFEAYHRIVGMLHRIGE